METPSTHDTFMRESRQGAAATAERRRRDHRFYLAMSLAVAITVVAGFAKTFYFKTSFKMPSSQPTGAPCTVNWAGPGRLSLYCSCHLP